MPPQPSQAGDPWAGFEEVEPAPAPARPIARQTPAQAPFPTLGQRQVVGPVDGDTLRLDQGPNLRLFGVDAPELSQPGFGPQGVQVPVGMQAKDAVANYLSRGAPAIGPTQMQSYGRAVAPVDVGGQDLGQTITRDGWAFAAPEYLQGDPQRLFDYTQAERLARLNGLGVHDYNVQRPQDFRRDVPFTPTGQPPAPSMGGLSASAQQDFARLLGGGTREDIAAFGARNGFRLNEAALDGWLRRRDASVAGGAASSEAPLPLLTDPGDGVSGVVSRGVINTLLGGSLEEAGALIDTLGATDGRENVWNSDRAFGDIWGNNRDQNAAITGHDMTYPPFAAAGRFLGAGNGLRVDNPDVERQILSYDTQGRPIFYVDANGAPIRGEDGLPLPFEGGRGLDMSTGEWGTFLRVTPDAPPVQDPMADMGIIDSIGESITGNARSTPEIEALPDWADMPEMNSFSFDSFQSALGTTFGGAPEEIAQTLQTQFPTMRVRQDANGNYILRSTIDGKEYGIRPGFRASDIPRAVGLTAAFTPAGRVASIPGAMAAAGGTQAAIEVSQAATGGNFDSSDVALAGAGGVGGVLLGRGINALRPGVRALTSRLTGRINQVAPDAVQAAERGSVEGLAGGVRNPGERVGGPNPNGAADEWAGFDVVEPAPSDGAAPGSASMAMDGEPMSSISQAMPEPQGGPMAQRLTDPRTQAQIEAQAAQLQPGDVLPIPGNEIADATEAAARDAGRFEPVRVPNERGELTRRTLRVYDGREVPVVGPVDMVGWLRMNGGLQDQGGELAGMGISNNAARRGMDFVGQEGRFGPMVSESGMTLDDAALQAWDAGYFPELTERPTINEFLDALRDTYDGRTGRRFLPDDLPEIENYYGRQSDRYAIQEQEFVQGSPVVRDLSQPTDEPQPFAPPEAYEEWPAGGPDLAGNIRLDKLESPQDISRALAQTEARVGFDAATRGRVTQAETERLAGELNMTPEQLLSRRRGQALNAEEALAARQLLAKSGNELVNAARRVMQFEVAGDDLLAEFRQKWMRHVAIQEQVSGMTAEAGRALQQFRMAASSRAVNREVLAALVKGGGGRDRLRDAAETILDASEVAPGVFNAMTDKLARPRFRDKVMELYINMLLSGPQTHAVNIASNTLTSLAQLPEYATASAIGRARQVLARNQIDRIVSSEVGARAFGLMQGAREGLRMFAQALRTGEASDFVSKVEGDQFHAISGLKGEVIRVPTRLLTAEDELFKGVARRMELNAQAVRTARREGLRGDAARARIAELSANPTDDMMEAALDYGRYLTFQRPLGPTAQDVSNLANRSVVAKVFLPFVRTPTNLIKFAVERSPAAPLLREWRKEFMAGGASRDLAIARASLGTGMGMLFYQAALQGYITGSEPSDPAKRRLLAAEGWKPNSIKIGDTYYSYRRLDPFSTTLGMAADMALMPEGMSETQRENEAVIVTASIMGNLASKTWLSGVSDLLEAISDPQRNAQRLLERLAGSFTVPTGVNQVARVMDPVARETDGVGEAIRNRIPGLSQDLMPRRNIWGQPITNEGGLGPDIVSPVWQSRAANDPVNLALLELDYAPGYPSRKIGGQELSPEDYDAYVAQSGQGAHDGLSQLVASPDWQAMTDDDRVNAAQRIVREARATARANLFAGSPAATDEWADYEPVE